MGTKAGRFRKRHWFGPSSEASIGGGHPLMFGFSPAMHFERFEDGGGYPIGFLERAYKLMGCQDPAAVLHLCSGSVQTGVRVDIRPERNPDIVADCRDVPLPDESFRWILADPPYSREYAQNLYGTGKDYPAPQEICNEACRLLKPGGKFGLLHFTVPMFRKPLRMMGTWGVTTGLGYKIRAFTLFEKDAAQNLFAVGGATPKERAT